jgi:hypothetical protein
MCSSGGPSGPSAAEIAAQRARATSAQNAGAQSVAAAGMMNKQRMRRHLGMDGTMTGAGADYTPGLGVGNKTGLGL